eukprot:scaffold116_cov61-Phaeocystis_antarctica.AAC.2
MQLSPETQPGRYWPEEKPQHTGLIPAPPERQAALICRAVLSATPAVLCGITTFPAVFAPRVPNVEECAQDRELEGRVERHVCAHASSG